MPIEWVDDGDAETMPRPAAGVGLAAAPSAPSYSEIAGAAFREANVFGSAIDMLSAQTGFKPDPNGHNPLDVIDGTPYLLNHADRFVGSQSEAETRYRMSRIDRETKNNETIAAGGVPGLLMTFGFGLADPTIALPGYIAVKGARGLSAARTALASGAAVGAGAAVQEGVLQATQELRTAEQSAYGIAGATLLGGVLGGAAAGLSRRQFDAIATRLDDMARGSELAPAVPAASAAGAASTASGRGDGRLADIFGLEKSKVVTNLSPVTRLQASEFDVARNTVREIADAGLELAENAEGLPTSVGGTIETRVKLHNGGLGKAFVEMDRQYATYFLKKAEPSAIDVMTINARETWARTTGALGERMTAREFREEVGKAMRRDDEHPMPEVAAAARAYRRDVFDPLKKLAQEVRLLGDDVDVSTAASYLTRVYDHSRIIARRDDFVGRLSSHLERTQPLDGALSKAEIRALADEVTDTILGNASRLPGLDIVAGPRGPLKERTLTISDAEIEDFLESDIERVARIYTRTMAADGELAAKFGDVRMEGQLAALRDEKNARIAAASTEPERTRIEAAYKRSLTDLEALRDRIRGTYKMPDNPQGMIYRAAKVAMNLSYVARLGGMTLSALTDVARPVMRYGLTTAFRDGFVPFVSNMKEYRLAADEVKLAGTALDMVIENRTLAMADLFDDYQKGSAFERSVEWGAGKFGIITLMSPWNATMKQITGSIAMAQILRATKAVAEGRATKDQIRRLASSGIDANLATRIHDQFSRYGARSEPLGDATKRMRDFVARTIGVRNRKEAIDLGRVRHPDEIAEALGLSPEDLSGFKHTVDNYALAHAQKRHGDDAKEALQGQVGLTDEDFARIPDILDNFDFVSNGGKTDIGRDVLIYEKAYGDTILYVEEVRVGKSELAMSSMRKIRDKKEGPARTGVPGPGSNVQNDTGIGRRIARREASGKEGGAEVNGMMLPNTENWIDRSAREAFRAALVREVDTVIVTPGLERPLWTSPMLGRVLSQFKGFGLASTQRILLAGLQQKDAAAVSGAVLSLGLGALAYWTKAQFRDEIETEKMKAAGPAKWAVEAADNSGLFFIPFEVNNMMEKMTKGRVGLSALTGETASRYASRNALGALLGPTFDTVGTAMQVTGSAASGEWTASDTRALRRLLPLQNVFYLRQQFDKVENGANAALGISRRKE